jgi:hypothetical protein
MELLIRTQHKQPQVSMLHETASQRGDVIAIQADGWAWSDAERSNPDWIIVTSDISPVDAVELMEAGRSDEPQWRRRIGIEVDGLQSGDIVAREQLLARTF